MKTIKVSGLLVAFMCITLQITAQQVGTTDVLFLITELPNPPQTVVEAYQRSYSDKNATRPDTNVFYKKWLDKSEAAAKEIGTLSKDFYQKNPMGIAPTTQPTVSRVSSAQQASMQSATSEMAQKMLSDPAFAQKFQQMSEQEQRAYITQMMANKGITPVQGTANSPVQMQPGLDVPWAEMCNKVMMDLQDRAWTDEQQTIEQRFARQHEAVNEWATKEIQKLPLILMGEYGHDRDPEKVKAITRESRARHAVIADSTMKEMTPFLMKVRQQIAQRMDTLNSAIKKVNYGKTYNFGLHYTLVLQTQGLMVEYANSLLINEISIIENCAKWEYEKQSFK